MPKSSRLFLLLALLVIGAISSMTAFAQTAQPSPAPTDATLTPPDITPTTPEAAPNDGTVEALTGLIIGLVNMNVVGTVSQYLVFAVFLALAITKLTPSKKDDEFVQRILDAVQNKTKKD